VGFFRAASSFGFATGPTATHTASAWGTDDAAWAVRPGMAIRANPRAFASLPARLVESNRKALCREPNEMQESGELMRPASLPSYSAGLGFASGEIERLGADIKNQRAVRV